MKKILVIGLVGNSFFYECDHLPTIGETIKASNLHTEIGGKGFNQAYTIYTLGGNVKFLTSIGNDETGKLVKEEITKLGVDTRYIIKDDKTAVASILTDKEGNNEVIVYPGATPSISDIEQHLDLIEEADIVLLQLELKQEVTNYLIDLCYDLHKTIILNPAPVSQTDICFDKISYLIPNEIEAKMLFGENYEVGLLKKNLNVVVTLGEKGAVVFQNSKKEYISPVQNKVVDTTGAGDVFCGAFTYSIAKGETLIDAIKQANILASKSITKRHVIESIKSLV